ncbi:MAG: PatB family C-S lyase [Desulfobacterales bacterium]
MQNDATFDFDTPIDRRETASIKWDKYRGRDVIPMWVADMDFRSPPAVTAALCERAGHGVFGYPAVPRDLVRSVQSRLEERYHWTIEEDWLVWLPGLVTGLNVVCRAVGRKNDRVLTTVPVYPPFLKAPGFSARRLDTVPLIGPDEAKTGAAGSGGDPAARRWRMNFDAIQKAVAPQTRLFILCHPHNPVGRAFDRTELEKLAEICEKNDLVVCSDEIHCDLILDPAKRHVPFAALGPAIADRTITLMAPSKTYNMPGLGCSFAVISNARLRARVKSAMAGIVPMVNAMGFAAALAAYRHGGAWHAALLEYLRHNRDVVTAAIGDMPAFSMTPVEATYLAWIDIRPAGLMDPVAFFESAGVGLQDGRDFGGPGYVRLNFGCPRSVLVEALARMHKALAERDGSSEGHGA